MTGVASLRNSSPRTQVGQELTLITTALVSILTLTLTASCGFTPTSQQGLMDLASASSTSGGQCPAELDAGFSLIHRLTSDEYNNTVRDLLFTSTQPASTFPTDLVGPSGFMNDSSGLAISDELVYGYYTAAEALANAVIASKGTSGGAYSQIVPCAGSSLSSACARTSIAAFAQRAFRRPITQSGTGNELDEIMTVFSGETDPDLGLRDVIISLLIRPEFLFVYYDNPAAQTHDSHYTLSQYELATRLSYFLWQSMPDAELLNQAQNGNLTNVATLTQEVDRMLKDPKALTLARSLRQDWATLRKFEQQTLQGLDPTLQQAMIQETELMFEDIIQNDQSLLTALTANYSFLNQDLATLYGVNGSFPDSTKFYKTQLPADQRKGVITQASVMMATAGATDETHLVRRGVFVASQVYCTPPGPKPANINTNLNPTLAASGMGPKSIIAQHASNVSCNYCHSLFDDFGFGLESYDPFGKWRTYYDSGQTVKVDPTGTIPHGQAFSSSVDMVTQLGNSQQVQACLAKQMVAYATARAQTSASDSCLASAIGRGSVNSASRFSDLIKQIVLAPQFRQQRGE